MGRLATVTSSFSGVTLPSTTGVWQSLPAGGTVVLTEAEAVLPQVTSLVTLGAITLAAAGTSPEPSRPASDKLAYANVFESTFTTAAGGAVFLGSNFVTLNATAVAYAAGFLNVQPNNGAYGTATGSQNVVLPANPGIGIFAPKTFTDPSITNTPPQTGPVPGVLSELNVFIKQGAAFSTPASNQWIAVNGVTAITKWPGGTGQVSLVNNALDYFQFVTYDGGLTWYNTLKVQALA